VVERTLGAREEQNQHREPDARQDRSRNAGYHLDRTGLECFLDVLCKQFLDLSGLNVLICWSA